MMLLFTGQLVLRIPRRTLDVRSWVKDIAVYNRNIVFLASGIDGIKKRTIQYWACQQQLYNSRLNEALRYALETICIPRMHLQ